MKRKSLEYGFSVSGLGSWVERVVLFTQLGCAGVSLDGRVGGEYLEFKVYMKQLWESPKLDKSICCSARRSRLETEKMIVTIY